MTSVTSTARFAVDELLGGPRVSDATPRSALDWVDLIRRGIPSPAVDALTRLTHLTQTELAAAVGIPVRTLARRKREGRLTSGESSRLMRLPRVIARGEEVFEDLDAVLDWLKLERPGRPNPPGLDRDAR
ncbi:MAG: antitoxin [Thiocapsa sp.]|jgi:putative toxin-antitoxin system antitoxin component (TIGR02293 family)|nr:antitoxin Xre-like helix-turn-helix domain-containing protein [Thiocapsa sp.]MCG6897663.1 antitoxin [Thiocapsa sp.]MCG6984862.1 antitoxin [Thiocapsa sp.]